MLGCVGQLDVVALLLFPKNKTDTMSKLETIVIAAGRCNPLCLISRIFFPEFLCVDENQAHSWVVPKYVRENAENIEKNENHEKNEKRWKTRQPWNPATSKGGLIFCSPTSNGKKVPNSVNRWTINERNNLVLEIYSISPPLFQKIRAFTTPCPLLEKNYTAVRRVFAVFSISEQAK